VTGEQSSTKEVLETRLSLTERIINERIDNLSKAIADLAQTLSEDTRRIQEHVQRISTKLDRDVAGVRLELKEDKERSAKLLQAHDRRIANMERYIWIIGGVTSILLGIMIPVTTHLIIRLIDEYLAANIEAPSMVVTAMGPVTAVSSIWIQMVLAGRTPRQPELSSLVKGGNSNDSSGLHT
jgi:hypothetical protein